MEGIGSQTFTSSYDGKTFESINNDLTDNPDDMPQNVQDGLADTCRAEGWPQASTTTTEGSGGGPTTTAPK